MPLPEHLVMEHSRSQDNGEPNPPPACVELSPRLRVGLLEPAIWQEGLRKYARTTKLAVALVDAEGRLLGECINPRPTWSLLHAPKLAAGGRCPFSLAPLRPCTCVVDALANGGSSMARDRTGLVHFALPLVLGEQRLGALVAGQVFDRYPEQLPLEQAAKKLGLSQGKVWELARREHPIKRATLQIYVDLLATLGQTFLWTRYHTILEADRLAEMTRLRDAQRARLLEQVLSAREEEQQRIGRDLHDGIGQSLTALLVGLRTVEDLPTPQAVLAQVRELRGITASALDEVHRLARNLRPSMLRDFGLIAALERFAANYGPSLAIEVLVAPPGPALGRLPAGVEIALYRVAQEVITNSAKHAAAKSVRILIERRPSAVDLTMEDDGRGFDSAAVLRAPCGGLGLVGIRERVHLLNGSVAVDSRPGSGTAVRVSIPLEERTNGEDSRPDR
jgi:signal transduction histidine kinase